MPAVLTLGFAPFARVRGVLVAFCGENLKFGAATRKALAPAEDLIRRAAAADRFTGKNGATLDIVAPQGLSAPRLVVIGTGKDGELKPRDIVKLGGIAMGRVPSAATEATILAEFGSGALKPEQIADLALGVRLRAYAFDRLQDQAQGRRRARRESPRRFRLCQSRRRREGVGARRRNRRRRGARPRPHQ